MDSRENFQPLEHETSVEAILKSGYRIVLSNGEQLKSYIFYLSYRVQRDLYEICEQKGILHGKTWEDFVEYVRSYHVIRDTAVDVFKKTLEDFFQNGYYDFKTAKTEFRFDEEALKKPPIVMSRLFSDEERYDIINRILFGAEIIYYQYQLNAGKDYSWEQYLGELTENKQMFDILIEAFRDAVARLDFKPAWEKTL